MLFETFETPGLAHYSYAVGCPGAGAMAIVDPRRDVDVYLDFAATHGMRISLDPSLSRQEFIGKILGTVPPFPGYYRRMKRLNSDGAPSRHTRPALPALPPAELGRLAAAGHQVVDLRDPGAFGSGHIPGSFGIGAGKSFLVWAPWAVSYEAPVLLVAPDPETARQAERELARVGLDDVRGYLLGGFEAWAEAGLPVETLPQVTPEELGEQLRAREGVRVVDVRNPNEWSQGHVPGALHLPLTELADGTGKLGGEPLALICGSGYRSTVAASVLERAGFRRLHNVIGGMTAWKGADLPTVSN